MFIIQNQLDWEFFDFQGLQYFDVWCRKTGEKTNQVLKGKKKQLPQLYGDSRKPLFLSDSFLNQEDFIAPQDVRVFFPQVLVRGCRFVPLFLFGKQSQRWYLGISILVSRVWRWFRVKSTTLFFFFLLLFSSSFFFFFFLLLFPSSFSFFFFLLLLLLLLLLPLLLLLLLVLALVPKSYSPQLPKAGVWVLV